MYGVSPETGDPIGIVNDFDLATWVDHPTTNSDRTGTIPFTAIDLLEGGLDRRTPRLYRHDMESFSWVLAYITIAEIEYKNCTIQISSRSGVDAWFRDADEGEREAHVSSKYLFHLKYGRKKLRVSARYSDHRNTVRGIARYWSAFHESREPEEEPLEPGVIEEEPAPSEPEVDDPAGSLGSFVRRVGESLGEAGAGAEFAEVMASLLKVIETPIVGTVDAM